MARLGQQAQPQVLDLVGVLIFVDHDIFEALAVLLQHVRVAAQHGQHVQQQIAEVAGVERLQPILIEPIELLPLAIGKALVLQRVEVIGAQALVLPAVDALRQLAGRPALFVQPLSLDQLLQDAQLIVGIDDRIVRLQSGQLGMAAQHLGGDGVEGAQPGHPFNRRADQMPDPLLHLARGLVGEGDAEDLARPGEPAANDMRQPRGQRRSLARAGPGQHQHRPFGREHSLALGGIQAIEQRIGRGVGQHGHAERLGNIAVGCKRFAAVDTSRYAPQQSQSCSHYASTPAS